LETLTGEDDPVRAYPFISPLNAATSHKGLARTSYRLVWARTPGDSGAEATPIPGRGRMKLVLKKLITGLGKAVRLFGNTNH